MLLYMEANHHRQLQLPIHAGRSPLQVSNRVFHSLASAQSLQAGVPGCQNGPGPEATWSKGRPYWISLYYQTYGRR